MDKSHLKDILDSGWNPPVDERVREAMEYVKPYEQDLVVAALADILADCEAQLKFQTNNISGSGNQQDFIDAYVFAYKSCKKLIEKYNQSIN